MLRFEDFHLLRTELELGLQFRHPGSAFLSFLVQAHQLCLQFRQATERFLAGRNLRVLRLDVAFTEVNRSFALSRARSKISNRKSFWNTARRSEPLAAPSSFISSC